MNSVERRKTGSILRATLALALLSASVVSVVSVVVACSSDDAVKETPPGSDAGGNDATAGQDAGNPGTDGGGGNEGGPSDCVMNPTTNDEIINACTNAAFVDKNPTLPLLLPDGGLPQPP
jgi:hypothetical protein